MFRILFETTVNCMCVYVYMNNPIGWSLCSTVAIESECMNITNWVWLCPYLCLLVGGCTLHVQYNYCILDNDAFEALSDVVQSCHRCSCTCTCSCRDSMCVNVLYMGGGGGGGGIEKPMVYTHVQLTCENSCYLGNEISGTLYMCMYSLQIVVPMTGVSFVYNTHVGQHILFMDCGIRLLMHHTIFEALSYLICVYIPPLMFKTC